MVKNWQSTPVFLPGKSHEQRSMAGFSPGGSHKGGHDLARVHARIHTHTHTHTHRTILTQNPAVEVTGPIKSDV